MPQPNILIVMTDHQRGDTVLPAHPSVTPHVEALARDGITFTNAFCPSPHCCPSRATFFTGLYPFGHGVWNNVCNPQALSDGLAPGVRLWSEDLFEAGYDLRFSGKWHVSARESPRDRGWKEHFVSADARTLHGVDWEHYRRLAREPERAERAEGEILRPGYGPYRLYGVREAEPTSHDEIVVREAVSALADLGRGEQLWCLYVGLIGPHDPYLVPQTYLDLYDPEDVPLPPSYADDLSDKPGIYRRMREMRFGQLSEAEVREAIRHYWAYCTYLDDLLGQMLGALDATGQAENTLVLYCSDHGDYMGEHGLFAKGIPCFRGAYHVPAVIRWPAGLVDPSRQVDALVSLADLAPTFLDAAGIRANRRMSGSSLLPWVRGRSPSDWRSAIHTQCNGVELYYTQRSVMTREWKYVFNGFDRDELYDLVRDPDEMRNLANDPAYAPIVQELCGRMWAFASEEHDTAINPYITVGLAPYGPAEAFRRPAG